MGDSLFSFRCLILLVVFIIYVSHYHNGECFNVVNVAQSFSSPSSTASKSEFDEDQQQNQRNQKNQKQNKKEENQTQSQNQTQNQTQDSDSNGNSDVMVSFVDSNEAFLQSFSQRAFNTRTERTSALTNALQSIASISQEPVIQAIKGFGVDSESYWITNQLFIKNAPQALIQTVGSMPMVKSVVKDFKLPLPPIFNISVGKAPTGPEWNIKLIGAHKIWNDTTGEGIVVGGIDTGVRGTHTSLKNNYVGKENYGWHDPFLSTTDPEDGHGHGTHTMGTAVGHGGVGVAPGSKWMACRGCFLDSCVQHALLACGQFMLCPGESSRNKKGGKKKKVKCASAPHVINNSWGGPSGPNWFEPVILAWRSAGIIPIFAMGNSGPKCESLGSPGENAHVLAVGSTDKNDKLSKFSSRGPKMAGGAQGGGPLGLLGLLNLVKADKTALKNITKPDVCAPGQDINSAHMVTDNAYRVLSGTSMAAPAVAGATALLLSANPALTYDEIMELFTSSTKQNLKPISEGQCGPIPDNEFPNHMYGHGRINVYHAYQKMKGILKSRDDHESDESEE